MLKGEDCHYKIVKELPFETISVGKALVAVATDREKNWYSCN